LIYAKKLHLEIFNYQSKFKIQKYFNMQNKYFKPKNLI